MTRILAHTLGWNFYSFYKVNQNIKTSVCLFVIFYCCCCCCCFLHTKPYRRKKIKGVVKSFRYSVPRRANLLLLQQLITIFLIYGGYKSLYKVYPTLRMDVILCKAKQTRCCHFSEENNAARNYKNKKGLLKRWRISRDALWRHVYSRSGICKFTRNHPLYHISSSNPVFKKKYILYKCVPIVCWLKQLSLLNCDGLFIHSC